MGHHTWLKFQNVFLASASLFPISIVFTSSRCCILSHRWLPFCFQCQKSPEEVQCQLSPIELWWSINIMAGNLVRNMEDAWVDHVTPTTPFCNLFFFRACSLTHVGIGARVATLVSGSGQMVRAQKPRVWTWRLIFFIFAHVFMEYWYPFRIRNTCQATLT